MRISYRLYLTIGCIAATAWSIAVAVALATGPTLSLYANAR
jgi:hypothetical protein